MCTCDKEEIQHWKDQIDPALQWPRIAMRNKDGTKVVGADGKRLFDSFGFRGRMPGECDECYEAYRKSYQLPI